MVPAWIRSQDQTKPCARSERKADATRRVPCRRHTNQLRACWCFFLEPALLSEFRRHYEYNVHLKIEGRFPSNNSLRPCRQRRNCFSRQDSADNTSTNRPIAAWCSSRVRHPEFRSPNPQRGRVAVDHPELACN